MGRRRGIERQGRGRRGRRGRRKERGRRGCDVCVGGREEGRGVPGDEGGGDWRRCYTAAACWPGGGGSTAAALRLDERGELEEERWRGLRGEID
ncbi:hypothetical protein MRB53_010819 [Persea americana]|uniref:Uncharacterized protein n=1 Tax=Persea americana TaxID=3435 RepID=A0ACC2LSX8_PERAE|nr:hypothetical protein MRB53_010819 [Persea americana]